MLSATKFFFRLFLFKAQNFKEFKYKGLVALPY